MTAQQSRNSREELLQNQVKGENCQMIKNINSLDNNADIKHTWLRTKSYV